MSAVTQDIEKEILSVLSEVQDPDLGKDIVSLGFIKNLRVCDGKVGFDLELTTPACPVKDQLKEECIQKIRALEGIDTVQVNMTSQVRSRQAKSGEILKDVKNVIAVASGKGGVGKSTTAVNLAMALASTGASVGLMDSDIYGPSIPMMLGMDERPQIKENEILPLEKFGMKIMSMGFLTDENSPVVWRGPMVHSVLQQFLGQVVWGELDYLVLDLPPGTGDAQLTITQTAPLSGAVIVTTPQDVALIDARKGLKMFEMVKVPVLGIVENMSYFIAPDTGKRYDIFGTGGGEREAKRLGVPFLGKVPIDPPVARCGDQGEPIVKAEPNSDAAHAFVEISGRIAAGLSTLHMQSFNVDTSMLSLEWEEN